MTHALAEELRDRCRCSSNREVWEDDGCLECRAAAEIDKPKASEAEIAQARRLYCEKSHDDIEVDDNALRSQSDYGVWVQGWLYVRNEELGFTV